MLVDATQITNNLLLTLGFGVGTKAPVPPALPKCEVVPAPAAEPAPADAPRAQASLLNAQATLALDEAASTDDSSDPDSPNEALIASHEPQSFPATVVNPHETAADAAPTEPHA